jgi:hypothetical protein
MFHEVIRATKYWGRGEIPGPRYDCVYVVERGVSRIARVRSFFSFEYKGNTHCCALIHWYRLWRDEPDPDNGMYIVMPEYAHGYRCMSIVDVRSIIRAAHLLPIFDDTPLPYTLNYTHSLDVFRSFYVNHYIDPHAYELV